MRESAGYGGDCIFMCGIMGYIGQQDVIQVLLDGLAKLEYRGYDSAGIAVVGNNGVKVVKAKGRLNNLVNEVKNSKFPKSHLGIGHTRWATHGEPSNTNSHPHLSNSGRFAVVHNGIIENYTKIKTLLLSSGYSFISDTDTEVVAQLFDYHYDGDLLNTMTKIITEIEGSYALSVVCSDYPDKLLVMRKDSPLVLGIGIGENFAASDISALLKYTKNMYLLEDGEIGILTRHEIQIFDSFGKKVEKQIYRTDVDITEVEKDGYEHFMMKEIEEQPKIVERILNATTEGRAVVFNDFHIDVEYLKKMKRIYIVACGSSYHVGVVGKYVIEDLANIPVDVDFASEFRYRNPIVDAETLVITISQSGETADTLAALREAKKRGAKVLSIVNVAGSSIARQSEHVMYTLAGPETAVATTKAYSAQLMAIYLLAIYISCQLKRLTENECQLMLEELATLPKKIKFILDAKDSIRKYITENWYDNKNAFFLGRHLDYALCLEGSLKMKEVSYVHSEAYPAGEFKHGAISLITKNSLVIVSAVCSELLDKTISNIKEVKARGAKVVVIANEGNEEIANEVDYIVYVPKTYKLFVASLAIVPLQLFGYYSAKVRGCSIDKPRNLAKSVTVE